MGQETREHLSGLDLETLPIEQLTLAPVWKGITGEDPSQSTFHVIVPVKDEEIVIGGFLGNIIRQQIPLGSSLVVDVVLNGTTDNTELEVRKIQKEMWMYPDVSPRASVRCTTIEKVGKAAAINYGRRQAQSDILINVDADVFPTANALAKIYALMRVFPDCAAASIMPRRIDTSGHLSTLHGMQEHYDAMTRENGAITGRFYAYKPDRFPEFPEHTMSDDTWLEFTALNTYGISAVKFLGQYKESDVAIYYHAPESFSEYFVQLMRWESSFQYLMRTYPELWNGCHLADRIKQPKGLLSVIRAYQEKYPEIPFQDKLLMHYFLKGVRALTRNTAVSDKFGKKSSWVSPKSDRQQY